MRLGPVTPSHAFALHAQPTHRDPTASRVNEESERSPEAAHESGVLPAAFAFAPQVLPAGQPPSREAVRERLLKWVDLDRARLYRDNPLALTEAVLRHRARIGDTDVAPQSGDASTIDDDSLLEAALLFEEVNGTASGSVSETLRLFSATLERAREQQGACDALFVPSEDDRGRRPVFNGFGLGNAKGKTFDDLLNDEATFAAQVFAGASAEVRRAALMAKFEQMGESTQYPIGSVEHAMASTVMRLQQFRGEAVTRTFERPAALIEAFRALECAWERDHRYPMHPRLMFALHLAHASGVEMAASDALGRRYDEAALLAAQAGLDHGNRAHLDWMAKYSAQLKTRPASNAAKADDIKRDSVRWITSALYEIELTDAQRADIAGRLGRVGTSTDALVTGDWKATAEAVVQYASERASAVFDAGPRFDPHASAREALRQHGMTDEEMAQSRKYWMERSPGTGGISNGELRTGDYIDEFLRRATSGYPLTWPMPLGSARIDAREAYTSAKQAFNARLPSDPWVLQRAGENLRARGEARTDAALASEVAAVAATLALDTETEGEFARRELVETVIGMVPFVGSLYNIEEGIRHHDAMRAALGVLFLGVDALTVMGGAVVMRAAENAMERAAERTATEVVAETAAETVGQRGGNAQTGDVARPHRAVLELGSRASELGSDARRLALHPGIAEITLDPVDLEPRDANVPDAYKLLAREVRDGRTDASIGSFRIVHLKNEDRVVPVREAGGSYEEVDWYTGHRVAGARVIMRDAQTGTYRTGGGLAGGGLNQSSRFRMPSEEQIRGRLVSERLTPTAVGSHLEHAQDASVRDFDRLFREHFAFAEGLPDPSVSSFDGEAFYAKMYERSPTFRRLFNRHVDSETVDLPQQRWKINVGDAGPRKQPAYTLAESKTIYLPNDAALHRMNYVTASGTAPASHERVYLHELIHALTGLEDPAGRVASLANRGPVIYLTDKLLAEAGYAFPERIMYWVREDDAALLQYETVEHNRPTAARAAHLENAHLDAIVDSHASRSAPQTHVAGTPISARVTVDSATQFEQERRMPVSPGSFWTRLNAEFDFDPSMPDDTSDRIAETLKRMHERSPTFRDLLARMEGGRADGAEARPRFMYVIEEFGAGSPQGAARPIREVDFARRRIYLDEDATQYLSERGIVDMEFKRKVVQRTVRAMLGEARAGTVFDRSANRGLDVLLTDRILREAGIRYPTQIAAQLVRRSEPQAVDALRTQITAARRNAAAEDRYLASLGGAQARSFV